MTKYKPFLFWYLGSMLVFSVMGLHITPVFLALPFIGYMIGYILSAMILLWSKFF